MCVGEAARTLLMGMVDVVFGDVVWGVAFAVGLFLRGFALHGAGWVSARASLMGTSGSEQLGVALD